MIKIKKIKYHFFYTDKPTVTINSNRGNVALDTDTVRLRCYLRGRRWQTPSFEWTFAGAVVSTDRVLVLESPTTSQGGDYSCIVRYSALSDPATGTHRLQVKSQGQSGCSDLGQEWVRFAPNGTYLGLFQIIIK